MDLRDMMRHLGNDDDDVEPGPTKRMTDAEIADVLRTIFAARAVEHKFTPGQVLRHKYPDHAPIMAADKPFIFIRYEDHPDETPRGANMQERDCVISGLVSDGSFAMFQLCAADFEPHPDFQSH